MIFFDDFFNFDKIKNIMTELNGKAQELPKELERQEVVIKCVSCGAIIHTSTIDKQARCEYCGSVVNNPEYTKPASAGKIDDEDEEE